jgi:hemolysin activation/secretion protein
MLIQGASIGVAVSRGSVRFFFVVAALLSLSVSAWAQVVPSPSQVRPPVIAPPTGGGHIAIPQVPAGAQIPAQAKTLSFKLLGFDIQGGFDEFAPQTKALEQPLLGKRITVAQVFEFADQLQQIYAKGGYPLVRVVILPQEFEGAARIKIKIIDGFIERFDLNALPWPVHNRVAAVLAPLLNKTHLKEYDLERALLIAGEAPGLVLNATFASGKKVGGSVLVLTGRYRPVSLSLYIDNDMPTTFGTGQAVTSLSTNSLLGLGEQLTLNVSGLPDKNFVSEEPTRRYLGGSFSIPLGIDGWSFTAGGTDGITTPLGVVPIAATKGVFNQGTFKIAYELFKERDYGLTLNERFEPANEIIESIFFNPAVPLSEDRVRPIRTGADGIWNLRESGTVISYGANYSRGLDAFGARTSADAGIPLSLCNLMTSALPLSRQCADAVFNKLDGHLEIDQSLPQDFFANFYASGQDSFHRAMLTSEQFDIDGTKLLSGFTAGSLLGDTAWVVRGELGHNFTTQGPLFAATWSPYIFSSTGERILEDPSILEIGSVHATNYGAGLRLNLPPPTDQWPSGYAFVEYSHRQTNEIVLDGDRIFTGILLQY